NQNKTKKQKEDETSSSRRKKKNSYDSPRLVCGNSTAKHGCISGAAIFSVNNNQNKAQKQKGNEPLFLDGKRKTAMLARGWSVKTGTAKHGCISGDAIFSLIK
ncbi:hypothetical protein CDAR_484591, partial [Caerostris darwini]